MEQNRNQELPPPNKPCRAGCGFYGTDASEGMCSKCYQDALKSKQAAPSSPVPSPGGRDSPPASSTPGGDCLGSGSPGSLSAVTASLATTSLGLGYEESRAVVASVETGTPTIPRGSAASTLTTPVQESVGQGDESQSSFSSTGAECEEGEGEERKKPKKTRCKMCKKRVGLTGFTCRCGGVFCGLHRYSDKHECEFDYRELAQHEIRKNNPVIVGEKVQKI